MTQTVTTYQVSGMSCAHCEMSVRDAVGEVPNVRGVEVSAQTGRLVVTADAALDEALILAAVIRAGYTAERVA